MPTLADFSAKLHKERNEPAAAESQRYTIQCMYRECEWSKGGGLAGFKGLDEATTAAQRHADLTGHEVRRRGFIELDCGIVRSQIGGR